jgi:D-alanyl-D-alanine carboxypeptidase
MKLSIKAMLAMVLVVLVGAGILVSNHQDHSPNAAVKKQQAIQEALGFNKNQFSLSDPNSPWIIVNKKRPLPDNFVPTDLRVPSVALRLPGGTEQTHVNGTVVKPLEELFGAAKAENVDFMLASGYRSAAYQTTLYAGYVAQDGQTQADAFSARPGYSEHQTGLAADIDNADKKCELEACFGLSSGGIWLAANAYKYGFTIRYPENKTAITGYQYEPWHIRYVGKDLAARLNQTGQTMEEFFNLPAAPNY